MNFTFKLLLNITPRSSHYILPFTPVKLLVKIAFTIEKTVKVNKILKPSFVFITENTKEQTRQKCTLIS